MKYNFGILLLISVTMVTTAFTGEDKFLKKYATMKIYESCFGADVIRQIRKEMKQACAKCANLDTVIPTQPPAPTAPPPEERPIRPEELPQQAQVYQAQQSAGSPVDMDRLHQAILAFRPNPLPQSQYRPYSGGLAAHGFYPTPYNNPAYSIAPPGYYPGYPQLPYSPYNVLGQSYYGNRMSRNMDLRSQMEALTSKMSSRVRNVTCVMQELGYLDENLEPNFSGILERIQNLPVNEDLKKDMLEGVTFCQQFSQCVPDVKKESSPLSREFIRPMFFFKCYKHKKLEACIMKDVREKFSGVSDEELESDLELRRTSKAMQMPKNEQEKEIESLSSSMYDFFYVNDGELGLDEFF